MYLVQSFPIGHVLSRRFDLGTQRQLQAMYGPWPAYLLSPLCNNHSLFNIYTLFYTQL